MRRILHRFELPLHPEKCEDAEPALVMVCGPSDSIKSPFKDDVVVVIQWRSPMGEDFYFESPRDAFVDALKGK